MTLSIVRLPPPTPWHILMYRRAISAVAAQGRHIRRRWYAYGPVFLLWALAYTRLFIDPTPQLPIVFNWTPSLPYRVAWVRPAPPTLHRGDYVLFAFAGEAQQHYPGLRGQPFFKRVRGLPGDTITVQERVVSINGQPVGWAKTQAYDHRPLAPIRAMTIPPGSYYVQGTSPDSFDSRYASSGLVRTGQVIGLVQPLF
jgi:conjugal transfer pilin signal peptidase TrbI